MKQKNKSQAFTLVELIVVIVILAILATIAFLSFSSQSSSARDSTRMADTTNITKGLGVFKAVSGTYPLPDNYITINAGTGFISYQGSAGKNVLSMLKMSEAKDNLDSAYYSYAVDDTKSFYSVGGFLENPPASMNIANPFNDMMTSNAADYSKRYFFYRGDGVGILTESGTNVPAEQLYAANYTVNLASESKSLNLNLSSASVISGTGMILGAIQSAQNWNFNYNAPSSCPTGFIPVPGNMEFNQPGFCAAKYEMRPVNTGGLTQDATGKTWNYLTGMIITSASIPEPIATVSQPQAIIACRSMGAGYHLITENEWMTVARNIEQVSNNWSSGLAGSGYLYSGHNDNSPANGISASTDDFTGYINTGNSNGNQKRTLILSNGSVVWDFAGNVNEHVNKANTFDETNIDSNSFSIESACNNGTWAWWSWIGNDGLAECIYQNGFSKSIYGPKGSYNSINGTGRIYATNIEDKNNIFLRGGSWQDNDSSGIFSIHSFWHTGRSSFHVGFRCAK